MKLRVARHTARLDEVVAFYRDDAGFREVTRFRDHAGYDGVVLEVPGTNTHLELTAGGGHPAPEPHPESLLVLFVADASSRAALAAQLGVARVEPANPYWREHAWAFADPDGFQLLLAIGGPADSHPAQELAAIQARSYAAATGAMRGSWPPESAMDAAGLGAFLEAHTFGVLATAGAEARALARPMAYLLDGGSFWVATGAGVRLRHLRRAPWVSLVVSAGDRGDHRAVVADGPVTLVDRPPDDVVAAWEARHGGPATWAIAWAELTPERVFSYAGSA